MIQYFFCILSIFIYSKSFSQNSLIGDNYGVELSSFYYWDYDNNGFGVVYDELSFSSNFTINLNSRLSLGLRTFVIKGRSNISPIFSGWHFIVGPNIMVNILKKDRFEFNIEGGYFFGNYCPNCTPENDYYNANLQYLGLDFQIFSQLIKTLPNLWFKFSFSTNNVIKNKFLNGYNLPLIGIQYRFGRN